MSIIFTNRGLKKSHLLGIIFSITAVLIIAGCGSDTPADTSTNPPSVEIISPLDNARYAPGDIIIFQAEVSDNETVSDYLNIAWTSSVDSALNQGFATVAGSAEFTSASLTQGAHSIKIVVTDPDYNTAADSITITIAPTAYPTTELLEPSL